MERRRRIAGADERAGRGAGVPGRRLAPVAAAAWVVAASSALAAPSAVDGRGGTYRMRGTASVDAASPLGRNIDSRGDAVVRAGTGGTVHLRLASMGQACELAAAIADDGALAFDAGQRCFFDLRDDARGHVEARLRTGRGRLRDRHLSLDLTFDLSGAVALRTSEAVQMMGVKVPPSWTPDIPLSGGAAVRAEGDRDESRAAER